MRADKLRHKSIVSRTRKIHPQLPLSRRPSRRTSHEERASSIDAPKNRLLAALPADDYRRLLPHLTAFPMRCQQVLQKQGETIEHVYFPNGGVCSVVAMLSSGATAQVAAIGDEGIVGIEAIFTDDAVASGERLVQIADGDVLSLSVVEFRRELARRGALHDIAGRYAHAKVAEFVQSVACNTAHTVQERCVRWLLEIHDRVHRNDFELSHELMAMMLGANRSTVTIVAGTLQTAGFIRYRRGHVEVLDREGLEAACCECYAQIRAAFARQRV